MYHHFSTLHEQQIGPNYLKRTQALSSTLTKHFWKSGPAFSRRTVVMWCFWEAQACGVSVGTLSCLWMLRLLLVFEFLCT